MVTDAAASRVQLPGNFKTSEIEEAVEHIGSVHATVYEIDDLTVDELIDRERVPPLSPTAETLRKLRGNAGSIVQALGRRRRTDRPSGRPDAA